MSLDAEQQCRAGEIEPAGDVARRVTDLVLAHPWRQIARRHAPFDQPLEPRVGDTSAALAAVEQLANHSSPRLAGPVQPFRGQPQPVEASAAPLEVVDGAQRDIGLDDAGHIDDGASQAGARDAVDDDEVVDRQRIDPVLDHVEAADTTARPTTDDLDRR